MTHLELAAQIQTMKLSDSKANDFIGRNVRCPSLVPGTLYLLKVWSVKHQINSDNPYSVVEFVGSGNEVNGEVTWHTENPAIKDMKDTDGYYFKGADKTETYEFRAYMHENCLCIASGAIRVTAYAIKGHESEGLSAPTTPRVKAEKRITARASKVVEELDDDNGVVEEIEDDGLGVPGARVCHPISMIPYKIQPW